MKVGVDLDGVIYPFREMFCRYIGAPYQPYRSWDFNQEMGISEQEYFQIYEKGVDEGFIFVEGQPYPDGLAGMINLRAAGHTLHIVTNRFIGKKAHINTSQWLATFEIPYDTLTFAADKWLVNTDTFIDDNRKNVEALRAHDCQAFLLDVGRDDQIGCPWLVSGWPEFVAKVAELEALS